MASRPGARQQQNQLVFGLTYRPQPDAAGQVHRFLAQKEAQLRDNTPNETDRARPATPGQV